MLFRVGFHRRRLSLLTCVCCACFCFAEWIKIDSLAKSPAWEAYREVRIASNYADGAFNVRSGGKGGRELQISTHRVKTRSEWQFWEQVQC
ncbi:unnamed protein product [Bathycoccus prasinos]